MAILDVYPTYWLRCRTHGNIFPSMDPIWGAGHVNCGLDIVEERWWPVIIINDPNYDPKNREVQRKLSCSECRGHGHLVGISLDPLGSIEYCYGIECGRCKGWGYV